MANKNEGIELFKSVMNDFLDGLQEFSQGLELDEEMTKEQKEELTGEYFFYHLNHSVEKLVQSAVELGKEGDK